jgi:hypothetical protein
MLAVEQRMVRAEVVFWSGGEVQDGWRRPSTRTSCRKAGS